MQHYFIKLDGFFFNPKGKVIETIDVESDVIELFVCKHYGRKIGTNYSKLRSNKVFRLVVRSSFVFASSNCDWLKLMTSLILHNRRYCWQKQMKVELQVEMRNKCAGILFT